MTTGITMSETRADENKNLPVFSGKVIEEYRSRENRGRIVEPDAFGILTGPCGDTMEIYLDIRDNRVTRARFMTDGCVPSVACGSMLTRIIIGKKLSELERITSSDLLEALDGLPEENIHCTKLAVDTLKKALKNLDMKDTSV